MSPSKWILITDRLPNPLEGTGDSALVLVVVGINKRYIAVATYNHATGIWTGDDYFGAYGQHTERLITHWMPLPALPPQLPQSFIETLDTDYVSDDAPMRALFSGVSPGDKEQKKILFDAVRENGLQWVRIQTSGSKKGNLYYVDFWVHDPLELRDMKQKLDRLDVPYTISAKK